MTNEQTIGLFRRRCDKIESELTQLKQLIQTISEGDNAEELELLRAENQKLRDRIRKYELEAWMNKHA